MSDEPIAILDELELDALTELVNLGVGRAAASLRDLAGEQVHLSVPNVVLVTRPHAIEILNEKGTALVGVHQVFEGDIVGRAFLMFPETNSVELVRAVTGGDLELEEIIELEQEALAETGNIVLNGCLSTIANLLQRRLRISLPEVLRGEGAAFFSLPPPPLAGDVVMFVYIDFEMRLRNIQGYLAMLMDMPSLAVLRELVRDFIQRSTGQPMPGSDAGR